MSKKRSYKRLDTAQEHKLVSNLCMKLEAELNSIFEKVDRYATVPLENIKSCFKLLQDPELFYWEYSSRSPDSYLDVVLSDLYDCLDDTMGSISILYSKNDVKNTKVIKSFQGKLLSTCRALAKRKKYVAFPNQSKITQEKSDVVPSGEVSNEKSGGLRPQVS